MPILETPPNPPPPPPSPSPLDTQGVAPLKVRAGRFGELDHSELVHLLDSLDDDRSRSRFRESIYLSIFVYLALAWFIFYGPKILFHQGRIINASDVLKQRDKELTYLNMPKDLPKAPPPKDTKAISDHNTRAQTKNPTLDKKTMEQLQAMRKAGDPGQRTPAPEPPTPQPPQQQAPPTPQPQQPPPPQQQAQNQPPPRPAQPSLANIPDAPKPNASGPRPILPTQQTPGQMVADAGRNAARAHGQGGDYGANAPVSHSGTASDAEVLSDTMGVDFGPYIRRILRMIKAQWEPLIPEECAPPIMKQGWTLIRFTINPNGVVSYMGLDGSSHDLAIDKAAWGGITGVGQMPPLPSNFKGENLQLRIKFYVNDKSYVGD